MLCTDSPAHAFARHPKLTEAPIEEEAQHFDIGTIAHALILEGSSVAEVLDFADSRKDAAKEARDAARKAGKIPILEKHWTDVSAMVAEARWQLDRHRDAKDAFMEGRPEQTLVWQDEGVGASAGSTGYTIP